MNAEEQIGTCPSKETLAALAANPQHGEFADVAAHVFVCEDCQRVFEDVLYPPAECCITDEERQSISAFVKDRCKQYDPYRRLKSWVILHPPVPKVSGSASGDVSDWRMVAAVAGGRTTGALKEYDMQFLYVSIGALDKSETWRATLTVPSAPTHKTIMRLRVRTGYGKSAEGTFAVAGVRVSLSEGRAEIPYVDFVKGLKDPDVYLERMDGVRLSGTLALV